MPKKAKQKSNAKTDAEMKIYTPHSNAGNCRNDQVSDSDPVRIYEKPYHPNQPTSPLG